MLVTATLATVFGGALVAEVPTPPVRLQLNPQYAQQQPMPQMRRRPGSGSGMIGAGSALLGYGMYFTVQGIVTMAAIRQFNNQFGEPDREASLAADAASIGLGVFVISFGGSMLLSGGGLLAGGLLKHRRYRNWAREYNLDPPPVGTALISSGAIVTGFGLVYVAAASVTKAAVGTSGYLGPLAAIQVSGGVGLLATGIVLRSLWGRWAYRRGIARRYPKFAPRDLAPTLAPGPNGLRIGLSAKF